MEQKDSIFYELFGSREPEAPVPTNKKANIFKVLYPLICIFIAAVFMFGGIVIGLNSGNNVSPKDYEFLQKSKSLQNVIDYVKNNYYLEIDDKTLIEYACMGVVENLDPYSYLATANGSESNGGVSPKLGITINNSVCGQFRVSWVETESDAYAKGVRIGDYILAVSYNGRDYYEVEGNYIEEFSLLVSLAQSNIYLKIEREGEGEKIFDIAKKAFVPDYVQYIDDFNSYFPGFSGGSDVAYLKLTTFVDYTNSSGESYIKPQIDKAFADFKAHGKTKLIIDLRGNTGGSPSVMAMLGDYVLKNSSGNGKIPMIKHEYSDGSSNTYYTNEYKYIYEHVKNTNEEPKFVVLVDNMSASASEAMVGAMLVSGTAELIGTTTYGKGIGQGTDYRAPQLFGNAFSSITVTTGYYYFFGDVSAYVSGAAGPLYNIHGVGFTPKKDENGLKFDFTIRTAEAYLEDYQNKTNILPEDKVFNAALKYFEQY